MYNPVKNRKRFGWDTNSINYQYNLPCSDSLLINSLLILQDSGWSVSRKTYKRRVSGKLVLKSQLILISNLYRWSLILLALSYHFCLSRWLGWWDDLNSHPGGVWAQESTQVFLLFCLSADHREWPHKVTGVSQGKGFSAVGLGVLGIWATCFCGLFATSAPAWGWSQMCHFIHRWIASRPMWVMMGIYSTRLLTIPW